MDAAVRLISRLLALASLLQLTCAECGLSYTSDAALSVDQRAESAGFGVLFIADHSDWASLSFERSSSSSLSALLLSALLGATCARNLESTREL